MRCYVFTPTLISLVKMSLEMALKSRARLISLGLPACRFSPTSPAACSANPISQLRTVLPDKTCSCKLRSLLKHSKGKGQSRVILMKGSTWFCLLSMTSCFKLTFSAKYWWVKWVSEMLGSWKVLGDARSLAQSVSNFDTSEFCQTCATLVAAPAQRAPNKCLWEQGCRKAQQLPIIKWWLCNECG